MIATTIASPEPMTLFITAVGAIAGCVAGGIVLQGYGRKVGWWAAHCLYFLIFPVVVLQISSTGTELIGQLPYSFMFPAAAVLGFAGLIMSGAPLRIFTRWYERGDLETRVQELEAKLEMTRKPVAA